MAELNTDDGGGGKGKHQKKRAKKSSTRVDMTPMVDLAALLLTFFMLTTQFSKPKAIEMSVPKDTKDKEKQSKVDDDLAITLLLDSTKNDKVYYYTGKFVLETTQLTETDLSAEGFRKLLLKRNKNVVDKINDLRAQFARKEITQDQFDDKQAKVKEEDVKAPFVIVKTTGEAPYRTVVDAIDELKIADIGRYALVDISDAEKIVLYRKLGKPVTGLMPAAAPAAGGN
jgi:biopolymer transport protein ExbD